MANETDGGNKDYLPIKKQILDVLNEISSTIDVSNRKLDALETAYKNEGEMTKEEKGIVERAVYELMKGEEQAKRSLTEFACGLKDLNDEELQKRADEIRSSYANAHKKTEEFAKKAGIPLTGWEEMLYR